MRDGDESKATPDASVLRFPQSRTSPSGAGKPTKFLGLGAMAKILGVPEQQATGHWCSRCRGVWYGYLLEVTCPACGNRHG
ncbi:hypothetical protein [Methylocella silvestris]|uniref:Uncharacterized protein n=1 Tax=Methylocella silvestris TaxID=199596 RepID=A0A2J7TM54_METSI|nr:hypothetical protein [Methylocella silvestris]PNG27797.1 hypothetical protein CR492_02520 [Methylocella silvestris]